MNHNKSKSKHRHFNSSMSIFHKFNWNLLTELQILEQPHTKPLASVSNRWNHSKENKPAVKPCDQNVNSKCLTEPQQSTKEKMGARLKALHWYNFFKENLGISTVKLKPSFSYLFSKITIASNQLQHVYKLYKIRKLKRI